ncbi:hypothetical protein TNCV_1701231 [Trichonephila clavipes]|nr:hypothetical protein TNCV_1701231 [Trichonephila clavipes]
MGPKKTLERIKYSFFWEGLRADVKKFCESCKKSVSSLGRLGLKTDHPLHLWQGFKNDRAVRCISNSRYRHSDANLKSRVKQINFVLEWVRWVGSEIIPAKGKLEP